MVSASEILPQADFDLQGVRVIQNIFYFLFYRPSIFIQMSLSYGKGVEPIQQGQAGLPQDSLAVYTGALMLLYNSQCFPFVCPQIAGKWCLTGVCSNFKWFAVTKPTGSPAMVEPTEDGLKVASSHPLLTTTVLHHHHPPDEYGLNHYINTGRRETFVENRLYGRSLDLSAEEKFNQLCLQTGILPANILPSIHPSIQCFSSLFILYMK
uniref:Uncharacterized protein n=1 Tax=Pundamilia nyererei TaxID=303518 RepID=A0A3B4F5J4_9CICH